VVIGGMSFRSAVAGWEGQCGSSSTKKRRNKNHFDTPACYPPLGFLVLSSFFLISGLSLNKTIQMKQSIKSVYPPTNSATQINQSINQSIIQRSHPFMIPSGSATAPPPRSLPLP
jgi:hypothetical protein